MAAKKATREKSGPRPSDHKRIDRLTDMRARAQKFVKKDGSHAFHSAVFHKQIVNCLYRAYFVSAHPEIAIAEEFWRCYRHLMEGGATLELPIQLVDKKRILAQIAAILRGEAVTLEHETQQTLAVPVDNARPEPTLDEPEETKNDDEDQDRRDARDPGHGSPVRHFYRCR